MKLLKGKLEQLQEATRIYFSRMRIDCSSGHLGEGVCVPGCGVCLPGVSAYLEGCLPRHPEADIPWANTPSIPHHPG